MLVSSSIYQACKFYEMFCQTEPQGQVSPSSPATSRIRATSPRRTPARAQNERLRQYEIYRQMLADYFDEPADKAMNKVELFEEQVKEKFVDEPGQMRLLIVVDKLLTGFDAPSATYLYIDKQMRDHGLFQAICRVNRLDGEDKDYGYIVDYQDLFKSLERRFTDYTSGPSTATTRRTSPGLLEGPPRQGPGGPGRGAETIRALCEPVEPPKGTLQYQHYFCAEEPATPQQLKANEPKRVELYKSVAALVRAYGDDRQRDDRGRLQRDRGREDQGRGRALRPRCAHEVKLGAGENIDFKQYEADMRYLLDTYIRAEPSETVTDFDDTGLVQLIVERGRQKLIDKLPEGIKQGPARPSPRRSRTTSAS